MSDSSDRKMTDPSLSANPVRVIAQHETQIMEQWLDLVVERIPSARAQPRIEVADHLLDLLGDIQQALSSLGEDLAPEKVRQLKFIDEISVVHGRERASVKNYTVGDVVHEYMLLRQVITGFCTRHGALDARSADIVNQVIEYSSLSAVNEFVRVTEEIQQKLVGSLVHDVRTPLGVAYNYVTLLARPEASASLKKKAEQSIRHNLKRAVTMLEELLDFMKIRGGIGLLLRFENSDINESFKNVCAEAAKIYSTEVRASYEDLPVAGVFDMALVIRSVENLISNAVKYGDATRPVDVTLKDCGDHIRISVHNWGEPIAKNDQKAIFSFFARGDNEHSPSQKSYGIGLTLIRTVAESHGGKVTLSSSSEEGTTFSMTLYKDHRVEGDEEVMRL